MYGRFYTCIHLFSSHLGLITCLILALCASIVSLCSCFCISLWSLFVSLWSFYVFWNTLSSFVSVVILSLLEQFVVVLCLLLSVFWNNLLSLWLFGALRSHFVSLCGCLTFQQPTLTGGGQGIRGFLGAVPVGPLQWSIHTHSRLNLELFRWTRCFFSSQPHRPAVSPENTPWSSWVIHWGQGEMCVAVEMFL